MGDIYEFHLNRSPTERRTDERNLRFQTTSYAA